MDVWVSEHNLNGTVQSTATSNSSRNQLMEEHKNNYTKRRIHHSFTFYNDMLCSAASPVLRLQAAVAWGFQNLLFEHYRCAAVHASCPMGPQNNCHQVQHGNKPLEIRLGKRVYEGLRLGGFFVLVSAWVSICAEQRSFVEGHLKGGIKKVFLRLHGKAIWSSSLFPRYKYRAEVYT